MYLFRSPRYRQWNIQSCHHCVQHPWKLASRHFWSSRNEIKPLFKQKCALRKCCGVSQKWWTLELSNLCYCVQYPWKLASRDFWSSKNKRKPMASPGYTKFGRQTFFWWWTIDTDVYWSRMAISHYYSHLVVKKGNFTFLLTSNCQEWQFHISTDILWSSMAIAHCYRHLVVKNGSCTLLMTSSGEEWQFHIATDI